MNNALIEELRKHGYHVLFGTDLSIKGICAEFEARGVDALIITSCYNELEKKDISVPFLSVTHNQKCFDVAVDMEYGGYLVGRHLLKHGHKKIACVSGTSAPKKRIEGLNRALEEAGLTSCGRFVAQESKGEVTDLVKNAGVSAFFCMNDFIAARVIQELQKHGIKVPQDVAVIGFDGLPFVEFVSPMLSTVVQPVQDLARKSVQILLDKLRGVEQSDKPVLLKPYLLPGGSCGCERNPIQDIVSCGMKTTLDDFIEENPRQKRIWKIEG
jgi:DNA-binding LacI/PurR family transcriptional regulator